MGGVIDALILFIALPLLGFGVYWIMHNDFIKFMFQYMKKKMAEKRPTHK